MIPKKAFRKKLLKPEMAECTDKQLNSKNGLDYLSASYNKARYSADLFSHLKQTQENRLEFMVSTYTEYGVKMSASNRLKTQENTHSQSIQLVQCGQEQCQSDRVALSDLQDISNRKRVITEDIYQLRCVLERHQKHSQNLQYIKTMQQAIKAQEQCCIRD